MSNTTSTTSSSSSFAPVLFLIFLVLKLTDNIDWSWWWVTSPLWIPITAVLAVCAFFVIGALLVMVVASICIGVARLFGGGR